MEPVSADDLAVVARQLQRPSRAVAGVGYRCPCGRPAVVVTEPRLPDGTPFPTTYYLTCPRATAACSTLESNGRMADYSRDLEDDDALAAAYGRAHRDYLQARADLGEVPEIARVSAGGMPDRVKCLHALAAHALSAGPGVNPIGDRVLAEIGDFWTRPCLTEALDADRDSGQSPDQQPDQREGERA